MSFDFSAWLVLFTFLSGVIWAFDALVLAPRRRSVEDGEEGAKPEPILVEYARSFFPVFLIVLVLRSFIVEPFRIPSASMMPTLLIGDFILVNKYDYGIRLPVLNTKIVDKGSPERGDIVVFRYPEDPSTPFITRVIGVPGDHVVYRDKQVFINGEALEQELIGRYEGVGAGLPSTGDLWYVEYMKDDAHEILIDDAGRTMLDFETRVPEGQYFVLGDNRDNSRDSRFWGFVPDENLIGRAFFIWMNWDSKNGGIGWSRIGTILQ